MASPKDETRLIQKTMFDPYESTLPPPSRDDYSMDELEDIEMNDISIPDIAMIRHSFEEMDIRITMLENSLRRRRCMPCGKRTLFLILLLMIVAIGANYFLDFSDIILGFVHEKGWL